MEPTTFSIQQHLLNPFTLPTSTGKMVLKLSRKVAIIAMAIFSGLALGAFFHPIAGGALAITLFYGVTAFYKNRTSQNVQELIKQKATQSQEEPPKISFDKEKSPVTSNEKLNQEPKPTQSQEEPPKISLDKEKPPIKSDKELIPFYQTFLKPSLDATLEKAPNRNLCFIKEKTAPFLEWLKNEYKGTVNHTTTNLAYLRKSHPDVDTKIFVDIRGDGDCTFRSMGVGLILQACLQNPKKGIEALLRQFQALEDKFYQEVNAIGNKIAAMKNRIENLRKEAAENEKKLNDNPKFYRMENGKLNEEGAQLKATFDEMREVALILEKQTTALDSYDNQVHIQKIFFALSCSIGLVKSNLNSLLEKPEFSEKDPLKIFELMQSEHFDGALIRFLRKAAALNICLNMNDLGLYVKQLDNEEKVQIEGWSILKLLLQRADAQQPKEEFLQGSIAEVFSISQLFHQPINYFRCQTYFDQHYETDQFGKEFSDKKPFYILNRPGHNDLIF